MRQACPFVAERGLRVVAHAGDDRGDLPAFTAARELGGNALVVEGPGTAPEVAAVPGVHLDGPDDVARWLRRLDAALAAGGWRTRSVSGTSTTAQVPRA